MLAPEWQTETPVLCIAGHGALDELAARMLAQLLGKHGLKARIVPKADQSRGPASSAELLLPPLA